MYALLDALLSIQDKEVMEHFLSDLCTPQELEKLSERWRVAQLLMEKHPYRETSQITGASTTTITRVARALLHGANGYQSVLTQLQTKKG